MTAYEIIVARQNGCTFSELARVSGKLETEVRRIIATNKKGNPTVKFDSTKLAVVREIEEKADEATEINSLHKEVCGQMLTVLEKAVRIGELLIAQKAKLPHGGWLPWVKANLSFGQETAKRYIRCYTNRDLLKRSPGTVLTIKDLAKGDQTKVSEPTQPKPTKPITFTHILGSTLVTIENPPCSWHTATRMAYPTVIVCRKCWTYTQGGTDTSGSFAVSCECKDGHRNAEPAKEDK